MKKANFILFILIVLLLLPTVTSAKSAQFTFWPEGVCEGSTTYNNIPFQIPGAVGLLFVRVPPPGDTSTPGPLKFVDYTFGGDYHATKIHFINTSAWVLGFPNNVDVAQITVCYRDDPNDCEEPLKLTIGVNTAEWAYALPGNDEWLGHTPPESAWVEEFYDDDGNGPYYGHHFYAVVDTDPLKVLDRIEFEWIEHTEQDYQYSGVYIDAITVETIDVPPKVIGNGLVPCEDGDPSCIFVVSAEWKEGKAWPTGNVFFLDLNAGLTLQGTDIRRFGDSRTVSGGIFLYGWGQVQGEDGYQFRIHVGDNGKPGAGNDTIRIRIIKPTGEEYNIPNQSILRGDITVKDQ